MNLFKKWWFWFILIFLVVLFSYSRLTDDPFFGYIGFFILFTVPLFSLIGLIINFNKNKKQNLELKQDIYFWIWLGLFIISLFLAGYLYFINTFQSIQPIR